MIPAVPLEAYYAVAGLVVTALGFLGGFQYASGKNDAKDLEVIDDLEGAEGFEMTSYRDGRKKGAISTLLRERKKQNALDKGVIRWHVIGSAFEKPKYIKPERKEGGNIPEVEHDGDTYYFPNEASVPAEEEGVPVVVHRKGESDPLNLRDDWDLAVDAGTLTQYLNLRVSSQKPATGLLDGMGLGDYDSMTIFRYGILGIVGLAIVWELIGGAA